MNPDSPMETLNQAIERLEREGYVHAFRPVKGGALEFEDGRAPLEPESLVVDAVVRFEGESNPGDGAVLFALKTEDGSIRGTLASSFGSNVEPEYAAAIQRLPSEHG